MKFAYRVDCLDGNRIIGTVKADGLEEAIDKVADEIESDPSNESMSYEEVTRNMTIKRVIMDGTQIS